MSFLHPIKESVACMFDGQMIRFFHVSKKGTNVTLKNFFSETIPELLDVQQSSQSRISVVERLTRIRKKYKFSKIHLVIPDQYITVFHTVMPHDIFWNDQDNNKKITLQSSIENYLKKLLISHENFLATDTIADYEVIQETSEGYHLHVSIARSEQFAFMPKILQSAGFVIGHVDIASFSIHRFARYMQQGALYGTIAMGDTSTQISIIRSGKVVASIQCGVGSRDLIQVIQNTLKITQSESEQIIQHYGILATHPDKYVLSALYKTLDPIVDGLRQSLMYCSGTLYNHMFYQGIPEQWYIYGIGSFIPGIAQYLGIKINAQVHLIDIIPTELMDEEIILQIPASQLPLYLPVMSTALNYLLE